MTSTLTNLAKVALFEKLYDVAFLQEYKTSDSKKGLSYNPLYGEITSKGLKTIFQQLEENGSSKRFESLVDLGSGVGRLVMLAFLFYENITSVTGIEMSSARFEVARSVVLYLYNYMNETPIYEPQACCLYSWETGIQLTVNSRTLYLHCSDIYNLVPMLSKPADVYICDFAFVRGKEGAESKKFFDLMKSLVAKASISERKSPHFILYERLHKHLPQSDAKELNVMFEKTVLSSIHTTWGQAALELLRPRQINKKSRKIYPKLPLSFEKNVLSRYNPYRQKKRKKASQSNIY